MATNAALEPRGYLVVKVLEAAGHNSDDQRVWDDSFTEGFAKIEIRGGAKTVKKQTSAARVIDNAATWEEQLVLEVLDGASELRILLCKARPAGERGSSIVSACGIYMRDIMEAVPIDKYFELFKPGEGAEGGFIRVSVAYLQPDQVRGGRVIGGARRGGLPLLPLLLLAGGAVALGLKALEGRDGGGGDAKGKDAKGKGKAGEPAKKGLFGKK